jgi:membrane protein DedA with SNARE-associated domain
MNWELVIGSYGYIALFLGTFVEGETILLMAGFAAHLGYLYLPWVILVAFLGSLSGDQVFFLLWASAKPVRSRQTSSMAASFG